MKRISIIFLAVFMVFAAACGAREPVPEPVPERQESESSAPKKPTAAEAAKHNEAIDPSGIRLIQFDAPAPGDEIAVISTTEGEIRARLFKKEAPGTVNAFIKLAREGYYDGNEFSERVDGYKIDGAGKTGDDVFPDGEFSLDLWNFSGAVAVSNNGSNFMIITASHSLTPKEELEEVNFPRPVIKKYLDIGGAPHQDWKNTVFGQVIEGMETAERIASATDGGHALITGISIETYE